MCLKSDTLVEEMEVELARSSRIFVTVGPLE